MLQPTDRVLAKLAIRMVALLGAIALDDPRDFASIMAKLSKEVTAGNPELHKALVNLLEETNNDWKAEMAGTASSLLFNVPPTKIFDTGDQSAEPYPEEPVYDAPRTAFHRDYD